jgi:predicted nucleic acid-binding protein
MRGETTLVCDASVVHAALNPRDRNHAGCIALLASSLSTTIPAPVIVEVDWLARSRGMAGATDDLLESVDDGSVSVVDLDLEDYSRVRVLLGTYEDLGLEFVDAAVVAVAERLEQTRVATLDRRHFSVVKPVHCEAFELVP